MRSALAALILLTSAAPTMASEASATTTSEMEIKERWADSARDARRKQILQGIAIIGGAVGGGLLIGQAFDIGSGPTLTPWTTAAGAGVGVWLAADVMSWRTARARASAAPTPGGARAALAFRW
jgi:hypothetical protein